MIQIPIAIAASENVLSSLLETYVTVSWLSNRGELEDFLESHQPRCLIIDERFPDVDVSTIVSESIRNRVSSIVLSRNMNTGTILEYFRAGAIDVLEMNSATKESIEDRISKVMTRSDTCEVNATVREDYDDFLRLARHDLKAPLRTISGFGKLLERNLRNRMNDEDREYLEFIVSSANKGYRLLERLKILSDIPTPIAKKKVSLENVALIASNAKKGRPNIGEVSVKWENAPQVFGDEAALVRLFCELIDNGLVFNTDRIPKVEISATKMGTHWQFELFDNGIGIDESHWQRVFDPLYRLNSESDFPGCGLGLSISRRIVESHGGTIQVRSSTEGATKVSFSLIAAD